MGLIVRIIGWLAAAAIVVIALALAAPWAPVLLDRATIEAETDFLIANGEPLSLTSVKTDTDFIAETGERPPKLEVEAFHGAGFSFPPEVYEPGLVLFGEIHGLADTQTLDLALIRHLNETAGMTSLMAEVDFAQAAAFNMLLCCGQHDEAAAVFEHWGSFSSQWSSREFYEKLMALYEFNSTVPTGEGVRFFGVDKIQNKSAAIMYVRRFVSALPDETTPSAVLALNAVPDDADIKAHRELFAVARDAIRSIGAPEALRPLAYALENLIDVADGKSRYEIIERNVRAMVEDFGYGDDELVYGFWGLFHAIKTEVNGARPLAVRLGAEGAPFAGVVTTIGTVYLDGEAMMPTYTLPGPIQSDGPYTVIPFTEDFPYIFYRRGIGALKAAAGDAPASIYHLSAEGAPYRGTESLRSSTGLMAMMTPMTIARTETPPFDYLIVSQGSAPLTPYIGETEKN